MEIEFYPALSLSQILTLPGLEERLEYLLRIMVEEVLFRADALTTHPTWANVGTVLYNEGIAVVKSPHVPFFGQDEFELKCKGEQNIHMLTVNIPAGVGMFNSSSNPAFKPVSASLDANEYDPNFVYITGLNLHDDNLNVIMRSNLAQPIKKRRSDEFLN